MPSALLAGYAVEHPYIGRKGTLALGAGKYFLHASDDITQRPLAKVRAHWRLPLRYDDCPQLEPAARVELRVYLF